MRYNMNTLQARNLVHTLIKQKKAAVWNSWTNKAQQHKEDVADKRNLCFAMLGEKFTLGDCKWIKLLVGCDKVHTTANGQYLRLVGVRYEN